VPEQKLLLYQVASPIGSEILRRKFAKSEYLWYRFSRWLIEG